MNKKDFLSLLFFIIAWILGSVNMYIPLDENFDRNLDSFLRSIYGVGTRQPHQLYYDGLVPNELTDEVSRREKALESAKQAIEGLLQVNKPLLSKSDLITLGVRPSLAEVYIDPLNKYLLQYEIDTPERTASFLGQILVESGGLQYTRELWDNNSTQQSYEFRADLGNTQPGDGYRFRGAGLIQLTGRRWFTLFKEFSGVDVVSHPEKVANDPDLAVLASVWWWERNNMNKLADEYDQVKITRTVRGSSRGWQGRKTLSDKALTILKKKTLEG